MYPGRLECPVIAYAGTETRNKRKGTLRFVGMGGLAWTEGKCWLWVDFVDMKRTHPFTMVREAKRMLKKAQQLGEHEVWARREAGVEPLSEKLLGLLGFERVSVEGQLEDWKWPRSPQSPSD